MEKNNGTVVRVLNGKILNESLLDVNVAISVERGMCGIAVSKNGTKTYVFLYFTEIKGKDGDDRKGIEPIGNRLYRYEFVDDKLVNPKLLLDIPAYPGPRHNGGAIEIGPKKAIVVGTYRPSTTCSTLRLGSKTRGLTGLKLYGRSFNITCPAVSDKQIMKLHNMIRVLIRKICLTSN